MWIELALLTAVLNGHPAQAVQLVPAAMVDPAVEVPHFVPEMVPVPVIPARVQELPGMKDPFSSIPQGQPLLESHAEADSQPRDKQDAGSYVVFHEPATFEVAPSSPGDVRSSIDTAIIYEGMALRLKESGEYTLRMIVETPATNVTMRMQFVITKPVCVGLNDGKVLVQTVRLGTITLPPIRLEAATQSSGEGRPRVWRIEHSGYSSVLEEEWRRQVVVGMTTNPLRDLSFIRIGTAEFGVVPQR